MGYDFGLLLLVTSLGEAREVTDAKELNQVASYPLSQAAVFSDEEFSSSPNFSANRFSLLFP